jgi:hypothetical protein
MLFDDRMILPNPIMKKILHSTFLLTLFLALIAFTMRQKKGRTKQGVALS